MSWYPRRQVFDGNFNVFKNLPGGGGGSSTPTPSTVAEWDANTNMSADAFLPAETSTVASSTPMTLTIASTQVQTITGTLAQIITLPITGIKAGYSYIISSQNTGGITVKAADGTTVAVLAVGGVGIFRAWLDGANDTTHWVGDVRTTGTVLTAYNGTLAITHNGTQTTYPLPTSVGVPAVAALAQWTPQANLAANWFLPLQTSTASSATPIALTIASTQVQVITGTTTAQTITLPTASVLPGCECVIVNQMTTANVTVEASGGTIVAMLAPNEIGVFTATVATPTLNTQWVADARLNSVSFKAVTGKFVITTSGTSVVYTLPSASSTLAAVPAAGVVKSDGSALAAAVAGTDYVAPGGVLGTPTSGNLANCTGLPGFQPSDYSWISWAYDPYWAYTSGIPASAGLVNFTLLPIRAATTITNVIMDVQTAGATLTSGQCLAGLFDSSGNLLSATADQSTNWQSTGLKTMALSTPQAVTAGLYYVGYLWNGTTGPKFSFSAAASAADGANNSIAHPRFAVDTTHTGRTTSFPSPATLSAQAAAYWAAVS